MAKPKPKSGLVASATSKPQPPVPSTLKKCRTVLAMAGRATAAADRMSEADQQKYAALLDDQGLPKVPHLIQAVKALEQPEKAPAKK